MTGEPEVALKVEGLFKDFVLPHERHTSLKSLLMSAVERRDRGYELLRVLRDVNFEIRKGEFFGVVGRNGSGKSTLLKLLAGIYQPTRGTITRNGSLVPLIELGVGFNMELTGRENIFLNSAMLGFTRRETDEMYQEIVEFADLQHFMDQKLKNYSSGMQVRLAFSIATRARADILLLDEVLAVGDADFQRKCFAYFDNLRRSDTTVILVSHSMDAIREYCDRAVLVEEGVVRACGTAEEVAVEYGRLFVPAPDSGVVEPQPADRWGVGGATYSDCVIKSEFTEADEQVTFEATLTPEVGFDSTVRCGFVIKNADGRDVVGTPTATATQMKEFHLELAGRTSVRWSLPNVFGYGHYTIALSVARVHDRAVIEVWLNAGSFSVRREPHTPILMAVPYRFTTRQL